MAFALGWSVPRSVGPPAPPLSEVPTRSCPAAGRSALHRAFRPSLHTALFASLASRVRRRLRRNATARQQQVLPFIEPGTGREVVLVACMHFNPQSVDKAAKVTKTLAEEGCLGALVLESCPSRWRRVQEVQRPGSMMRLLLDNEMQAAGEVAESAGREVILGDQSVDDLFEQITRTGKEALDDLLNPLSGGWQRTVLALSDGFTRLFQASKRGEVSESDLDGSIGIQDLLDPLLILGTPLAIVRYVVSTVLKAPQVVLFVGTYLAVFAILPDSLFTEAVFVVTEVLLLRTMLGAILRDRDAILARSVKDACEALPASDGSVVAILGAAHCNGVKRYLTDDSSRDDELASRA